VQWMFAETRSLAEDWAYRWLAASAALPGPISHAAPRLQDERGRRARALADASQASLTVAEHAARSGITAPRARRDLAELVREGHLVAERAGRMLTYRTATAPPLASGPAPDAKVTPQ